MVNFQSFVGEHMNSALSAFGQLADHIREDYRECLGLDTVVEQGYANPTALAEIASLYLAPSVVQGIVANAKEAFNIQQARLEADRDIPELLYWQQIDREVEAGRQSAPCWEDHFDNAREAGY